MFKTILVATDNSEHSCKAVELAGDIANKYGAKLILLYVIHPQRINQELRHMVEIEYLMDQGPKLMKDASDYPKTMAECLVKLNENADDSYQYLKLLADQILRHANKLALNQGVEDAVCRIEDGDPAHEILECANRENADLIVVGSRGIGDLKGLLMGSVSHKVSQHAKCSCVIVK